MGFRSVLITDHYGHKLPEWFKEKYNEDFNFLSGTLVSSKAEIKLYSGDEFFQDYQKALAETGILDNSFRVNCVVLHEDGVITKVVISKKEIEYFWILQTDIEGLEMGRLWSR